MSRSYPIWHEITNCNYQSSKSYGNRNYGKEIIYVGSSADNSHEHCTIEHKREFNYMFGKDKDGNETKTKIVEFKTYIDDILMVTSRFTVDSNDRAKDRIDQLGKYLDLY